MRLFVAIVALVAALWAGPSRAEVAAASAAGFIIEAEAEVAAAPAEAWRALLRIQNWWGSEHTYSGDARRLRLDPRAGGCWCERWGAGQSIEHARVVLIMERDGVRTLRVLGGLGPLQELGVTGVLTFTVAPRAAGARLTFAYRVSGDAGLGLDQMAPIVDQVLMEQFARLARYAGQGFPG